ncbi:unnamed protein product [Rotaria sp. Silwood2]|nr:unnamed protein product [Rotaria sp. Silwood2]CAF2807727.1 unnamed protein product [Rotaria sp. Silwood2]CAF3192454.1 unnamed protein product [Rotaria sp. Silwood2]CAF3321962.1 unnamed protein product [Rotaria sp. Silwood2]CAF3938602.1 unnamed protein product [Rotaria sp. Silwood2]
MNYPKADDKHATFDAQQLLSGELKSEDYQPVRELERIKKANVETLQHKTNGWIDTAKAVLTAVIDVSGLMQTCGPAINAGILKPDDVVRATQHVISLGEAFKRIDNRACDNAVKNSDEFFSSIENNENTSKNSAVQTALEQHRNDVKEFQSNKVNINVSYQSHAKLRQTFKQVEPNQQSDVYQKAEQSSQAWNLALYLGQIVLAISVIVGMVLLKC